MAWTPVEIKRGLRFLCINDSTLAAVVRNVGPFTLTPDSGRYEILVRSILSQQISLAAARTIRGRLQALLASGKITAKGINALTDDQLRSVGVSQQKQRYLRHLTSCTLDGTINFRRIAKASDDDAIAELVQVKGIGRWTAQMFLMFALGRIDIFAPDDLGLRNAVQKLYKFPDKPTRAQLELHAERWRPYRTIASWYLWRSLEQDAVADEYPV
ncbi:MAG: DNA-3-methyladenine glycosylase 2 family protein [Planctomycetaceae bacterium]|nr:DNA-3-methyladenine glycosylase 2 family protein [Planctomycetaceae bacterium]